MKKLAVCIPTYNRPDKIRTVLENEADFLRKYGADIHIFDSSETAETKEIITGYSQYGNVYYHKIAGNIRSSEKVFRIYEKYAGQYEYIWIIHDHTVFTKEAFCYLLEQLEDHISYYFLKVQSPSFGWKNITDLEGFFYETAWLSVRFGTVILKSDPFLHNVDWKYFRRKYLTEKKWNFSHIGFYFERASQIADFRAKIIEFPRDLFSDISNNEKIGWYQDCIRICLECWGEVILSLPERYTNKQEVLQTQDKWFLSKYSLITYKKNGVYGFRHYWKYGKWFKKVAPDERKNAFLISLLPVSISCQIYTGKLISEIKKRRLKRQKICIYGAGRHGIECVDYLEACGIKIDAFLVTKKEGNPQNIREYPVYQADSYVKDKKVFAVIAIMSERVEEVKAYMDSLKEKDFLEYTEFI